MSKAEYAFTMGDGTSPSVPSVYQLGLWLAAVAEEYNRLDEDFAGKPHDKP